MTYEKLAKKDLEEILKPFAGVDIKSITEVEDKEFGTKSFVASILPENYTDWVEGLKKSEDYVYDSSFEDYTKDTEYGQIAIHINNRITIEVKYNIV